jgi:hypothetical protein
METLLTQISNITADQVIKTFMLFVLGLIIIFLPKGHT